LERVKSYEVRTYIPEKKQAGQRHWENKTEEQQAVYQNRRRVRGGTAKAYFTANGTLSWNADGDLGGLVIADGIPGATDSQTCSFV
jgi:hypothetical protein